MEGAELNDGLLEFAGGDPFRAVRRRSEIHQAEHGCGLHNAGGPVMAIVGAIARAARAQRILDLGSGLGYSTLWLADSAGPAAHVTGIDADPTHTAEASDIAHGLGFGDRVRYLTGTVADVLPSLTGTYDLIHDDAWFADRPDHLERMVGLLRPGGTLTMANWFLLFDAMTGIARNNWESFAGPGWEARTIAYAEHLAARTDLEVRWITSPPVGIATKQAEPSVPLDTPMAALAFGRTPEQVADPALAWQRPDRAFFAAGACHILAEQITRRLPDLRVVHLRPHDDRPGSHVFATDGTDAFDFNGWTTEADLIAANVNACRAGDPTWSHELVVVEGDLDRYWQANNHRTAGQYPGDVVARAERYIDTLLATDTGSPPQPQP